MARIPLILLLLSCLASLTAAASAPTFCKCTCFTNSTIIPLGPAHDGPPPPANPSPSPSTPPPPADKAAQPSEGGQSSIPETHLRLARAASSSCNDCNRRFCLEYNLPICKGAEEKDVVTMCFQRDSRKDQIIVWGFILGTAGLLGWAGLRRVAEMREGWKRPLGGGGGAAGAGRNYQGRGGGLDEASGMQGGGSRGSYRPLGEDVDGRGGGG